LKIGGAVCLVGAVRCDNNGLGGYFCGMSAMDDDDRPKKKKTHEIGQDLTLLSVEELADRIASLKEEIARLEANMAQKRASRSAADQFFKS
jgi:uncharacterized small protein (DUF1192 family)